MLYRFALPASAIALLDEASKVGNGVINRFRQRFIAATREIAVPRFLSEGDVQLALRQGRAVEQWLGDRVDGDDRLIKWIRVHSEAPGKFTVTLFDVFDEGTDEFQDVYEFRSFDPDEPYGTAKDFPDESEAISYAVQALGASTARFVNGGMIQDEYRDFITKSGPWFGTGGL